MATTNEKILETAKANLKALGNALGKIVGTALEADNVTNSTDLYLQLTDVKESFTRIYGKLKDIPDAVYTEIAKTLIVEIDSIVFTKYSKDELIDQLATTIENIFTKIDDKEITVDGTTYKISFKGSRLGLKGKFIRVSDGDKESWLNWKNESYGKSVMARYLVSVFKLDTYFNEATFPNILTLLNLNGSELFSAVLDGEISLKKVLGSKLFKTFGSNIQYKLESLLLSVSNDSLRESLFSYVGLNNAYKNLSASIDSAQSVDDIKGTSEAFTSLATTLNTSLSSFGAAVTLETLQTDSVELEYNEDFTIVTIPAGYTNELVASDYKSSVKTIYAGDLTEAIIIHGNAQDNIITGGAGKDKLYGDDGNDTLRGGTGNDSLMGGKGKDKLYGDDGNDTLRGGTGNDSLMGGAGKDKLYGDDGNDTLRGGTGNDSLTGGAGKDKLYGDDGNDTLRGGTGNDSLMGGAGKDKLYGDDGNDTLRGGTGNDSLMGGKGADAFVYTSGNDVIVDYTTGEDKIYLASGSISKVTKSGKNVTFKVGSGSIKVQNGKDKAITFVLPDNSEVVYLNSDPIFEDALFMDNKASSGELDSLMNTFSAYADVILTDGIDNTSLLGSVTLANTSTKKILAG